MERFIDLGRDMSLLWENYKGSFFLGSGYLGGIRNTLVLAVVATLIGVPQRTCSLWWSR